MLFLQKILKRHTNRQKETAKKRRSSHLRKETHEPGESNSGRTAEILCVLYEKRIFLCCGTQGSAGSRIIRRIFLATIKEIAEKAGVSTTTVSNVIHRENKKSITCNDPEDRSTDQRSWLRAEKRTASAE